MDFPGEKLVIKLWETVAEKGVGSLFKPWQMRREGRASIDLKREEMLILAQAEQDAERIRRGNHFPNPRQPLLAHGSFAERQTEHDEARSLPLLANDAVIADTIRREVNVTRALLFAEEVLETDPQCPPKEKVEDDWLFRWRESASQVSSEELQQLWGRLLAGEVKAPGSYSLRTLEFLKNLSQKEAQSIAQLSQFVVGGVIFREAKEILDKAGATLDFLLYMQHLGVIAGVESLGLSITWKSNDTSRFVRSLTSNSMVLIASADNPEHTVSLPIYHVTAIGHQVLRLGSFEPNIEYLKVVGAHLKKQNVAVKLAKYVHLTATEIEYFEGEEL